MGKPITETEAIQRLAEKLFTHCRRNLCNTSGENENIALRLGYQDAPDEAIQFLESDTLDLWILLIFFGCTRRAPDPETVGLLLMRQAFPDAKVLPRPRTPDGHSLAKTYQKLDQIHRGAIILTWSCTNDWLTKTYWADRRSTREILIDLATHYWEALDDPTPFAIDIRAVPGGWEVNLREVCNA